VWRDDFWQEVAARLAGSPWMLVESLPEAGDEDYRARGLWRVQALTEEQATRVRIVNPKDPT
jgi:hypothetical protein